MSITMASSDLPLFVRLRVAEAGRRLVVDDEVGSLDLVLDGGLKKLDMLADGTMGDDVEACMWVSKADTSCNSKTRHRTQPSSTATQ